MTALIAVEMRRFLARRLVRVIAVLALAGTLFAAVLVFFNSSPDATFAGDQFHLASLHDVWLGVGGQLVIVAWLLGASFAGAEWHSGSMGTLLTWEPRRQRVFIAKLVALLIVVYLGTVALELLIGLVLWPVAAARGSTVGVDAAWIGEGAALLGRVGLVVCVGASLGFGLAMVGRNTAASLGVGFGYLIIVENLIRGFRPQWSEWLFVENSYAFLAGSDELVILGRSLAEAGLVTALYGAVALLAGWALFRRRDVA